MGRAFDIAADQPWAILPDTLETILSIAGRYNDDPESVAAKLGRPMSNTRTVSLRGDTAVIPVRGPISRYMNIFSEISGGTSVEVLATDFQKALDDPGIGSIVLDIDSPGGTVAGVSEFASMVAGAEKPVTAYVSAMGASAAYWIASAADRIVLSDTASVGSIGVVATIRTDKAANQIEIVSSQSPNKRVDVETDEGRTQIQSHIDKLANVFISAVATGRGVDEETVMSKFGHGGLLVGDDAVSAGMADEVGSLESVIAAMVGTKRGVEIMAEAKSTDSPKITREYLAANHSAMVEDIKTEGYELGMADGIKAGAEQERTRIQDVEAQSMAGHEPLIASMKYDGKTTGAEAAIAVLQAEKTARASVASQIAAETPAPVPSVAAEGAVDNLPMEDRCKAKWAESPEIREEFGNIEAYIAYVGANDRGSIKVLGGKK